MKKLSAGFKQFMGITDDEERLFDYFYKRERNLKRIILALIVVITILSIWKL